MSNEELVQAYQAGDNKALNGLVENNKGIVLKLANRFITYGINSIDFDDLIQEGTIGIMIAAGKYDLNNPKKAKFITYAIHWIYQKMSRFIKYNNTNDEISLNADLINNEGEANKELIDTIRDDENGYENIDYKIYLKQLRKELETVMNERNTLREREILMLHYGWDNNKCMSFNDIGNIFNISPSRVREIENYATRKIRHSHWGQNQIKEYYRNEFCNSNYNLNKKIEAMDFENRYSKEMKIDFEYIKSLIEN